MKTKCYLFLFMLLFCVGQAIAQGINVTGTVIDETGEPIIGASILVKGTTNRTVTDLDGNFALTEVKKTDKLVFSYIGMETVELSVKPQLKVTMRSDSKQLEEVMVVAFGQQKKSSFTGSAAVVKGDALLKRQVTSVAGGLQGQVAGMQMTNTSGDPTNAGFNIAIRGFSSINAGTSPLIIVDGAPYDGGWNNLNPSDVESITVLKDAASNALYGARGANGVIMITTKKGTSEKATITLDAKWGVNSRATQEYDYVKDPAQYYEMHYLALYNSNIRDKGMTPYEAHAAANNAMGKPDSEGGLGYMIFSVPSGENLIGTNGKLNPHATLGNRVAYNGKVFTIMPDNWLDEGFRKALRQEYNLSITGGSQKLNYYSSFGYLKNEGIVYNSDYQRYTARFKADYQAKEWLRIGANMGFTHSDQHNVGSGTASLFGMATNMAPIYPVYMRDGEGNIMTDEHGLMYDYGMGAKGGQKRPSTMLPNSNPLQTNQLNTNKTYSNLMTLTGYADITPFQGLKLTVNGTVSNKEDKTTAASQPFYGATSLTYPGGYVQQTASQVYSVNFQQIANYITQIGRHNITLMAGHENYKYNYNYVWGSRQNMFSFFESQVLDGAVKVEDNGGNISLYNTEGYFSRAMYNFDEKYFLSASYRRDASSRFHPDHRWGNFYSLGGAWTLNKEEWFKVDWVNMLKLKASWGQQGNDNIGDYRYTDTFSLKNFNGQVAFVQSTVGNKNITWETNSNFNIGVDFELFKSRLTGSVEYFRRKTTDMLCIVYVPLSSGYFSSYDNVGDMLNQGVEIDLHYNVIRTKDFNWTVNFNATHYKNKVLMLNEDNKNGTLDGYSGYVNGNYFTGEGLPLHTFRLKRYAGVNEKGESTWYMKDSKTGELTTTTEQSRATYFNCGSSDPTLYGGLSTSFSYKGIDLSVSLNYNIGGKAIDSGYRALMSNCAPGNTGKAFHKDLLNAWSETNTTSDIPRFQYAINTIDNNSAYTSDRFLTNATTLSLQNINIGYTVPRKWANKLSLSSIRLYASGENLYYWSKRKGFDPRGSFWGTTSNTSYSAMRTFSGGVTVSF